MTAITYKRSENVRYFNIVHGNKGAMFGYWLARINKHIAQPVNDNDIYTFTGNNYTLVPYRHSDGVSTDKLGNTIYSVSSDNGTEHIRDIILFWEIPNRSYVKVDYKISGSVTEIGKGYTGRDRGEHVFKSTAPILEVFGDCTLEWTAVDLDGLTYTQTITYVHESGSWDVQVIKNKE